MRLGMLGAAWIGPMGVIEPAREIDGVELTAVAARDPGRARAYADEHGIPRVFDSYEALVASEDVDAIYNPLPNSHHALWTIAALEAGKPVLLEKPFTANAEEARRVAEVAERTGLVVMEAFHWRFHPQAARAIQLVGEGAVGEITHVEAAMIFPSMHGPDDIRYRYDLAGGALMDTGSYALSNLRVFGELDVVRAEAVEMAPDVDQRTTAELRYRDGDATASVVSAFTGIDQKVELDTTEAIDIDALAADFRAEVVVSGTDGKLHIDNPLAPMWGQGLTLTDADGATVLHEAAEQVATYTCQLRDFRACVEDGGPNLYPPSESIKTMELIDAVYQAAGLPVRQGIG
ncbi:Gfo/Idh/MocA family protein [Candidatus Poriferisocius sp.]|uniref:Gfo/Idh/MocA family protein n=1 Tax=Candidatus Poriferisocius sp. TaxID=3101276 RepID=UPI003B5A0106